MTKTETTVQSRLFSGGAIGLVSQFLNIAQAIITVPLILRYWDQETYGIWTALLATQALFSCLDQGHQAYLGAAFNLESNEQRGALRITLGSAVRFTVFFGLLEILIIALVGIFGGLASISGIQHEIAGRHFVNLSLLVLIINNVVTGSLGGILVRLYTTYGRFVRGSLWGIALRLVQFFGMIGTVALGGGVFAVCVTTTIIQVALFVAILIDLRRLFPEIYPWWNSGSFKIGMKNFFRSTSLSGSFLLEQASFNGLALLISHSLGSTILPLFTTLRSISSLVYQGGGIVLQPLLPDLARYHVNKEPAKIMACIETYWVVAILGLALALAFTPWAEMGYTIWTRNRLPFQWMLFISLFWSSAARIFQTPLISYFAATNAIREQVLISLARTTVVILGALVLLPRFGVVGAGLALVAADAFAGLPLALLLLRSTLRQSGRKLTLSTFFSGWRRQ
jgi:O-antigen/teichoic acid export membrane protein